MKKELWVGSTAQEQRNCKWQENKQTNDQPMQHHHGSCKRKNKPYIIDAGEKHVQQKLHKLVKEKSKI